jgi:hypothetical protein
MLPYTYEWVRYVMAVRSAERRRLSGEVRFETGTYYNGDLNTIEARATWKPSALLALELTGEWNHGEVQALIDDYELNSLASRAYKEQLFGFRLQLNMSSDLQFSSLTQYDAEPGTGDQQPAAVDLRPARRPLRGLQPQLAAHDRARQGMDVRLERAADQGAVRVPILSVGSVAGRGPHQADSSGPERPYRSRRRPRFRCGSRVSS